MRAIVDEWKAGGTVKDQLGGTAKLSKNDEGHPGHHHRLVGGRIAGEQPEVRKEAFSWLAERVNTFVNVLRPRMRSVAADCQSRGE